MSEKSQFTLDYFNGVQPLTEQDKDMIALAKEIEELEEILEDAGYIPCEKCGSYNVETITKDLGDGVPEPIYDLCRKCGHQS